MKEYKKQLANLERDVASVQKKMSAKERSLEEKHSDRHGILKQCKMDDIRIPLSKVLYFLITRTWRVVWVFLGVFWEYGPARGARHKR